MNILAIRRSAIWFPALWGTRNDLNGTGTFITGAVRRMLGYEPEELVDKETVLVVHPDRSPRRPCRSFGGDGHPNDGAPHRHFPDVPAAQRTAITSGSNVVCGWCSHNAAGYPYIVQHTAEHALIEMALGPAMKFVHSEDGGATLDFALGLLLSHQSEADRSLEAFLKRRFKP